MDGIEGYYIRQKLNAQISSRQVHLYYDLSHILWDKDHKNLHNLNGHFLSFLQSVNKMPWIHTLEIFILMLFYTVSVLNFIFILSLFLTLQVAWHPEGLGLKNCFILNHLANLGSFIFPLVSSQKLSISSLVHILFLIFYHRKLEEAHWHFVHSLWEFPQTIHEFFMYSFCSLYYRKSQCLQTVCHYISNVSYIFQLSWTMFCFVSSRPSLPF